MINNPAWNIKNYRHVRDVSGDASVSHVSAFRHATNIMIITNDFSTHHDYLVKWMAFNNIHDRSWRQLGPLHDVNVK